MKISQLEIEQYCKSFLKSNYNFDLAIPIKINPRTTSTLGCFVYKFKKNEPIALEFSKKFLEHGKIEEILSVIKHECIHYVLFMSGKPFLDGENYFENELLKHNIVSTNVIEFKTERNVRVYSCKCNEHVFLSTILPSECNKCKGKLVYVGKRKQLV